MSDYSLRFGGIGRLYGSAQLHRIQQLSIAVAGLGGVGSWAAEALVRSGVGHITLIDMDDIAMSNTNRQLHTLQSTVGQSKAEVLAQRFKDINPELSVTVVDDFIQAEQPLALIPEGTDGILDAIDSLNAKTALLAHCVRNKIKVVTTGGAGGQIDPTQIKVTDLARVQQDPLMAKARNTLRRNYGFSRNPKRKFGIDCVYSEEQLRYPLDSGEVTYTKPGEAARSLDCSSGFGASMMVTGTFGLMASAQLLKRLLQLETPTSSAR
ncbi:MULTISPECIES: tRNA cyclic N6-threonylcarbamoyladenosine(37) synthase TcdA [Gammaproteobacteria]|uniref:tRNA cyclic N6-threonylcarbamoyladenosine(37) synthase TcdA n=1 Tax=Gammaproteobacteria TaxID=1236 RepID=UPI000DD09DCF|nr:MULTISPECIES: tRNA cyclic N6-threonylcarbamoyladenosine(37) synthase TcdA [Gammaproteobacteria]RTE86226.1 tRNA cyclic N6-threonylcarbamoyladenosine(37) synthase TcdA [Aliidiomarina sp. B3213]TCZ91577.1 tRNA cyclic N6-threonylcarbamoyladenosine(37) synthase TcdA [Lysobacter sp. N42]